MIEHKCINVIKVLMNFIIQFFNPKIKKVVNFANDVQILSIRKCKGLVLFIRRVIDIEK